ncbi:MAG: transketolase [Bacilli bacterium]|nr:transketolase [Bacilli bacterium]
MKAKEQKALDNLAVAAIRSLAIDEINKANSGHPGMALDAAPIVYTLFKNHIVSDPKNPDWINRDRFVLSAGHASSLLYAMLHLTGYGLTMDDLKSFRQMGSKTPGHPEYGWTKGVDATAGPLGQGITQAVGMAIAEASVSAQYENGKSLLNHYTYCLCGDGCLEEGVSQEAISLAGHMRLNKLILIYDENGSTLDGPTSNSLSENMKLRFMASEWNVLEVKDGNDLAAIDKAIAKAKKSVLFPTLIIVHTVIGYGSKKQGTSKVHGAPLGAEDGAYAKKVYGYEYPEFTVPSEVYSLFEETFAKRGEEARQAHLEALEAYKASNPEAYKNFMAAANGDLAAYIPERGTYQEGYSESTRNDSGKYLVKLHASCPFVFGGSADVAASVMTNIPTDPKFSYENRGGRDVNWGIREFAMAGAQNGILLHGGLKTYVGCFLIFSDYMKSAIRMSCLEKVPAIYLFSHDSIAVGEDGPTHEPIEQLAMLRSIPGIDVIRPADARETEAAWEHALLRKDGPTAIILSRQKLPLLSASSVENASKGAYLASKAAKKAQYTILATGSEVSLAIQVQAILLEKEVDVEVVSMPSWEVFEAQDEKYKKEILHLAKNKRISLEMLSTFGWGKYADINIGLDEFGASAPAKDVIAHFGFDAKTVAEKILKAVEK